MDSDYAMSHFFKMIYNPVLRKSMCHGKKNKPEVRQAGVGAAITNGNTIQQELGITCNSL